MIRSSFLPALLLALTPLATQAQTHQTAYAFDSVLGVMHTGARYVSISGIPVGETTGLTVALYWNGDSDLRGRCEKLINLVLSEPGVYVYTLITEAKVITGPSGVPETFDQLAGCGVHRKVDALPR